jgi:hypothetical protein
MATGNSLPLHINQTLTWKTRNFPDNVYNLNPKDLLTTLMSTLLGNSGVGQLLTAQVTARLTQQYLQFSDLENTIGGFLNAPRLTTEFYNSPINPFTDQLTPSQWDDVFIKDSNYRERLLALMTALLKGGTVQGIQATAEATAQVQALVVENWTTASGNIPSGWSGGFDGREAIIVYNVPAGLSVNNVQRTAIANSLQRVAPIGTIVTQVSGSINNFVPVPYTVASTSSELFNLPRTVVANNINIPSNVINSTNSSVSTRYWLQQGIPITAPNFAFTSSQEVLVDVTTNISNVTVTPITASRTTLNSSTTQLPLGTPSLPVASTVFGGQ